MSRREEIRVFGIWPEKLFFCKWRSEFFNVVVYMQGNLMHVKIYDMFAHLERSYGLSESMSSKEFYLLTAPNIDGNVSSPMIEISLKAFQSELDLGIWDCCRFSSQYPTLETTNEYYSERVYALWTVAHGSSIENCTPMFSAICWLFTHSHKNLSEGKASDELHRKSTLSAMKDVQRIKFGRRNPIDAVQHIK